MSLNVIETLKTSIYNLKHLQNTKIHFQFSKSFKHPYSPKLEVQKHQRFMLICMALFLFDVEGHTAKLVLFRVTHQHRFVFARG